MPVCSAFKCNARTGCNKDDNKVTFHRFPLKQPDRLKIWIRITQKDHWTPTPNSVLCSRHFKEDCFDRTGQTTRIRADAVPTILLFPRKKSQLFEMDESQPKEAQKCPRRKRGRPAKASRPTPAAPEKGKASIKDPPSSQNKPGSEAPPPGPEAGRNGTSSGPEPRPPAFPRGPSAAAAAAKAALAAMTAAGGQPNVLTYFSYVPRVEPKPLFPTDHQYAVTESPVRLKRRCNSVTDKLEACRKKLKTEQQKVRRWHRDVAKLKAEVKALRKESAAPPSCADVLEHSFSGVPKDLMKRMLAEKRAPTEYTDELKAFAFKLRLLSPKAYNYVRGSFKQALPHPTVVKTWRAQGKVGAPPEEASAEDEGEQRRRGAAAPHARVAVQQCQYARLRVKQEEEGDLFSEWVEIHKGMVVYICFFKGATEKLIPKMVKALLNMKLFEVGPGKQASVMELPGSLLVVPQHTLGGQAKRRSMLYPNNLESPKGLQLYASFVTQLESQQASSSKCMEAGVVVRYGVYGEKQALLMDSDGLSTHIMEF